MKFKNISILLILAFVVELFSIPINISVVGNTKFPGVYNFDTNNRVSQVVQFITLNTLSKEGDALLELQQQNSLLETNKSYEINPLLLDKNKAKQMQTANLKKIEGMQKAEEMLTKLSPDDYNLAEISYRRVILIRNGKAETLNLQKFLDEGDTANNPYLMNDDVIKLLPLDSVVEVTGSVNREGKFEIISGDRISDAINFALGFSQDASIDNIRVERYSENGKLINFVINYNDIMNNSNSSKNILLQHNDIIKVFKKPFLNTEKSIEVKGMVNYPGTYSIDDSTTVLTVLENAGGPLPNADLNFAILIDKESFDQYDPDLERLLSLNITTMSTSEYSYYQSKIREIAGKHFLNIKELWETKNPELDRIVRNGDMLIIKEPFMMVNVSGAVHNAGLQPWEEGLNWSDYVKKAGGTIPSAFESKVRVIRQGTRVWVKANSSTVVNPGDEVFIPEHEDMTTWDYIKEGLSITAQAITIIIGVHSLTK